MEEPLDTVINGECSNLHCMFRFYYSGKSLCLLNMLAIERISPKIESVLTYLTGISVLGGL